MATKVNQGKIWLAAFDGPYPENPMLDTKISKMHLMQAEL